MTKKQIMFCDEYLTDLNATRAYKTIYKNIKNDNVAAAAASRLLEIKEVKSYIDKQLDIIHSERTADAKEVMEYLTSVMRRECKENIVVTITSEESKYVSDDKGSMRKQTVKKEIPQIVEIPAKLSDSNKAAELLGKAYGTFKENINIEGDIGVTIVDDI